MEKETIEISVTLNEGLYLLARDKSVIFKNDISAYIAHLIVNDLETEECSITEASKKAIEAEYNKPLF